MLGQLVQEFADFGPGCVVQIGVLLGEIAEFSRDDVPAVSRLLGETFDDPRPTNTTIICGFPVPQIKVEIEVVALRRADAA